MIASIVVLSIFVGAFLFMVIAANWPVNMSDYGITETKQFTITYKGRILYQKVKVK
jgi:hypothetical protein